MIERAASQPTLDADGRFERDPRMARVLQAAIGDAQQIGVVIDAREALAAKSMASGVPVAELAQRAGAIDAELVDWKRYVHAADTAFRLEAHRHEAAMARIDAALADREVGRP